MSRASTIALAAAWWIAAAPAQAQSSLSVSPTTVSLLGGGGSGSLTVSAAAGTSWTIAADSWIFMDRWDGVGAQTAYDIAGRSVENALAGTWPAQTVSVSVSPTTVSLLGGGGSGSLTVSAPAGTSWTIAADSWISMDTWNGVGTQTVTYSVAANASGNPARTGAITVTSAGGSAGVTVSEAALQAGPPTAVILNSLTNGALPAHQPQQTLRLKVDTPNGPGYLNYISVFINNNNGMPYGCQITYYPIANLLYFTASPTTVDAYTPGAAGQATGVHCGMDVGASRVTFGQTGITLELPLTIERSAVGMQNIYATVVDNGWNYNDYWTPVAAWLAYDEITTAPPTVSVTPPAAATSQMLHYRFSDGNGYTYLYQLTGVLSADASANSPCYFLIQPPSFLLVLSIANYTPTVLGQGYIGGGYSSSGTGIIGAPGQCWIDLNNSRIHVNPDASQPDPDPNSGLYTTIYVDLTTTLEPAAAAMLPMGLYLSAYDAAYRFVGNELAGTWPKPVVAAPTFTPAAGTYTSQQTVTISTATGGASIRYTTDGSVPSSTVGTLYTAPVAVNASATLKAIAYQTGWPVSAVTSASYTLAVSAPSISPAAGTYTSAQSVTISSPTPGASIRYTTDGSIPTSTSGAIYTGPFVIASAATVKATAYRAGWTDSAAISAAYTITGTVAAPTFGVAAGTYTTPQTVSLNSVTPGASIRYTMDGSTPTETVGTIYNAPIAVNATATIKAVAYESGWTTSAVSTAAYTITGTVATPTFSVPAGAYTTVQSVALNTTTPGATIRYTTDGTAPTLTTGNAYSGPIAVTSTTTLRAIAYLSGWNDSAMASASYTLNLPPADFTMTLASGPAPWLAGMSGTFTFTLTASSTFNDTVTFTSAQAPGGSTISFNPSSVALAPSASAPVTVTVATRQTENGGVAGYFNPIVTASATSAAHSLTVPITLQDFGVTLGKQQQNLSLSNMGGSLNVEYAVQGVNGFDPSGVTLMWKGYYVNPGDSDFNASSIGSPGVIGYDPAGTPILHMDINAIPPSMTERRWARIIGYSGTVVHYAQVEIDVNIPGAPDFTVGVTPPSQLLSQPGFVRYPIVINSGFNYSGQVSVSVAGVPAGISWEVDRIDGTPQTSYSISGGFPQQMYLKLTTTASSPNGTWPLTVTATDGTITKTASVSVTVGRSLMQQHTITSFPTGLPLTVDDASAPCTSPCTFQWTSGTSHTVSTPSLQSDTSGSEIVFSHWTDGGSILHTIVAGDLPITVSATFSGAAPRAAQLRRTLFYVLNDGLPTRWPYCLGFWWFGTFYCDDNADARGVSQVSASRSGVSAAFTGSPSTDTPSHPSTFDVTYTASDSATPGPSDLSFKYSGHDITIADAVDVYDATPRITSVVQDAPLTPGGPFSVQVTGANFGAVSGSLIVCALPSGAGPCTASSDFPTIQIGAWSMGVIWVTLGPSATASGQYCIQVSSLGAAGTGFTAAPGLSTAVSNCAGIIALQPSVSVTPSDVSGAPGDTFTFTASGFLGNGSYTWQLVSTQDGDNPGAFQFVSQPACAGQTSCSATVRALGPGFAGVRVAFQNATATARLRAIRISISKVWSDQFTGGPVANYLVGNGISDGDGTPGSGAGAGLVGNARQLLILGPRQAGPGDVFPTGVWKGFIKVSVVTEPTGQEAQDHVLVRVAQGSPVVPGPNSAPSAPPNSAPEGAGGSSDSVFSVAIDQQPADTDYTVVAGVNRQPDNRITDTLTAQQVSSWFYKPCAVAPAHFDPCSNGAVRIASFDQNQLASGGALAGAFLWQVVAPTAASFLHQFLSGSDSYFVNPTPASLSTSQLLFNNGVVLGPPTGDVNLYSGPANLYTFPSGSPVAERVHNSPDFLELVRQTIQMHKAEIAAYFNGKAPGSTFNSPAWQALGCDSVRRATGSAWAICETPNTGMSNPSTQFDYTQAVQVDTPALFPCLRSPSWILPAAGALPPGVTATQFIATGAQCDLTFANDPTLAPDLYWAFGRVGYDFSVTANITATDTSQFKVNSVSLAGYIYDSYQWNPATGNDPRLLSNVQAAADSISAIGHVFHTRVAVDTLNPIQLNYTLQ